MQIMLLTKIYKVTVNRKGRETNAYIQNNF